MIAFPQWFKCRLACNDRQCYQDNNTFLNQMGETSAQFTFQPKGEMKVKLTYPGDENKPVTEEATLMLKYR